MRVAALFPTNRCAFGESVFFVLKEPLGSSRLRAAVSMDGQGRMAVGLRGTVVRASVEGGSTLVVRADVGLTLSVGTILSGVRDGVRDESLSEGECDCVFPRVF